MTAIRSLLADAEAKFLAAFSLSRLFWIGAFFQLRSSQQPIRQMTLIWLKWRRGAYSLLKRV